MSHPNIHNKTPFAFEAIHLMDESGRPLLVTIVKATYVITPDRCLMLAGKQLPIDLVGKPYGEPPFSSYKYEPETAFIKLSTDVVLIGSAVARTANTTELDVTLEVGPVKKQVHVVGDRIWVRRLGIPDMTNPKPFERIPLTYERSFGGWDSADRDPLTSKFEPRNPVGVGFKRKKFDEGMPLPNLEDPKRRLSMYGDSPPPAGFGFVSPHWQPRAALAGTYGESWEKNRAPLLPVDFDPRFFNAASTGLVTPEYLRGHEPVVVHNTSPSGTVSFRLPGVEAPQLRVQLRGRIDEHLQTNLDTVMINTDDNLLLLIWRANLVLRNGPHDVAEIEVRAANLPQAEAIAE